MHTRRLGLTRNNKYGPPVSQIHGKPTRPGTHDGRGQEQEVEHNEKKENSKKLKQEPATDDEPVSSSEEEEEEEVKEEEEEEVKNDSPVQTKEGATKRKRKERDSPASNKSQKSNPPPDEGIHSAFRATKKKGMGYTKSSSQSVRSSQNGFKQPTNVDIKDPKPKNDSSFQVPLNIDIKSSPRSQNTDDPSTNIHAFRMPMAIEDSAIESLVPPVDQIREPASRQYVLREPTTSAPSSALTFRDFDINDDQDTSSLSSPPSDVYEALEKLDDEAIAAFQVSPTKGTDTDGQSRCPNCNAPVDADLLGEFLALPGRRLRDERLFCEGHKAHNAEKEWTDKGYPTIEWHAFDKRVQRHFSELECLLVPSPSSFFRGRLESAMKAGQAKVFKLSLEEDDQETLSCGYYGPKGASRMLNSVTSKYSRKLRQLAAMDNVLKTAGPTTYAQAVLVPELTVLLIKEDMNVDSQDARQILRDSMDIGIRLNAAEDDQIRLEEKEEEDNGYM